MNSKMTKTFFVVFVDIECIVVGYFSLSVQPAMRAVCDGMRAVSTFDGYHDNDTDVDLDEGRWNALMMNMTKMTSK